MKLSKIQCLVSSIALLGVLASCGPRKTGSSSTGTPGTGVKPTGPVTVTFWHTFGKTTQDYLANVIEDFEELVKENEGVEVNVEANYRDNYDEVEDFIIKGFGTGSYPNIAVAYPDNVANYLYQANEGTVVDLEDYFNDEEIGFGKQAWLGDSQGGFAYGEDDFVPAFIEESRMYQQDGAYSIPFMKSSEVMFYNKDAFYRAMSLYKPAGVNVESEEAMDAWLNGITWDELMAFASYIKDHKDDILTSCEEPVYYDSDSNLFITKLIQNDIPYSDIGDNGMGVIGFESGENRTKAEAQIQALVDAHNSGVFTTKALEGTYGSNAFVEQKTIFSIGSSGGTGYNIPTSDSFEVGICRVPPVDNDHALYVNQGPTLTMFKTQGEDADIRTHYAWEFVKYITNPDVNARICVLGSEGYVPVRVSGYESAIYQEFLTDSNDPYVQTSLVLQNDIQDKGDYIVTPVFVGSSTLRDQVGTILSAVITQNQTVSQAFSAAINNAKQQFH